MKTWEEFKQHDCQISTDSVSIDKRLYEQIQRDATAPLEQRIAIEERNHPFYKELVGDFEAALGPHPTIPNGQWIRRISELRNQLEQSQKACAAVLNTHFLPLNARELMDALGQCAKALSSTASQDESPSKCQ